MADQPLRAVLDTDPSTEPDRIGYLRFESPDGRIDVIMVTDGPSYELYPQREAYHRCPVWHIDIADDKLTVEPGIQLRGQIVVSPSIDIKDRYHTANPVVFQRVTELPPEPTRTP